ncbi:MAG: TIGR03545 family protein [Treponema sp.]|jgi:uncharacterized protein (TIGR03545 family)|nr:TIGR03545 family protein [Treponema sp.]
MNKEPKPGKTPWAFKKPIKKNTLEKKYLKNIEHPQDNKFFRDCFELKDDFYVIRQPLTKDEVKKLKGLIKVVKANRKGAVKVVPLLFAASVVGAIVIFFAVFANPLLGRALEMGLEAIFEARANVRGFRLTVVPLGFRIGGITVANKDAPMTNLFEMQTTRILLRTQAILRGKVYIETIRCDAIRFGTERKTSGALPGWVKKEKPPKAESDAPPLIDLQNFDAMALLNQEFDKLNTPKLYDEAINTYNELSTKWTAQVENTTKRVEEVRTVSQPIMALNASSIRDIETLRTTIQQINNAVTTVQAAANDATTIARNLETDVNRAIQMEANARNSITNDINLLKSYIDLDSGAAFAVLEPFLRDMLSGTAQQYLDYGLIALDALQKIKANSAQKPKTEKPPKQKRVVFKGRDVHFPTRSYPAFYLGELASDFTIDSWNWAFALRDVSSDPDLTNKPVTLEFATSEEGRSINRQVTFNGSADFRKSTNERFTALANANNFSVSLGDDLSGIGIKGLTGLGNFSVNMKGNVDDSFSAGANILLNNARLVEPSGTIAEAVGIAIEEAPNVTLGIQYAHHIGRSDEFKITTNIFELIGQAFKRIAERYVSAAIAEIERVLRQKIDEYIGDRLGSKEDVDRLLAIAKGDRAAMDQMKNALDAKKNEFEQRITSMANEAVQQATQQAQQAIQNALPSLPSFPRR